jgi:hypothetical protein
MAARLRKMHDEETRQRIRSAQLINRLHDCAFGKIELRPSQVRSIEILLRKTLPDLSAVEATIDDGVSYVISGEPLTMDEFEAQYCVPVTGSRSPQ